MPFIPHTKEDVASMLAAIGVKSIEDLFDEIPKELRAGELKHVPPGRTEMEMLQLLADRAKQDETGPCFLGAGSYDHHIPAAVWDIVQRGEFMTAYTPYQAEASQGTLQLIWEYQSMIASLTGMDVSNASVYDGGSGLAEAVLMAVRANKKAKVRRVLAADTVHPLHRRAARDIVKNQRIVIDTVPFGADGRVDIEALKKEGEPPVALVLQQPNFFGLLEDVDTIANWASAHNVLLIAVVSPLSLALLKPPSEWGDKGADIVCGDGQPFGIPMASGGPSFGFMCCREPLVRQMPGRIIGRTVDLDGKPGFTLTLQAREQHIRRAKATSNICTNQGLLVTAATIHMSILGAEGLRRVAIACHETTTALTKALCSLKGVAEKFSGPFFHERVLRVPGDARAIVESLARKNGIIGGLALGDHYPTLEDCILVCATEKRTAADIERYRAALADVL
jgi:glycine dehydrogenase subunit 1